MKTYKLDQSQLDKEKKSIVVMYGITLLILVVIAVSINWGRDTMQSLLWLIPLMAGMYIFMGFRSYKQRKAYYEGYSLQITETELIQNQPRMRELRFALADITNVEIQKKGMLVSIKQAKNVLGISKETMKEADYQELQDTLVDWAKRNTSQNQETMSQLEDQPVDEPVSEVVDVAHTDVYDLDEPAELATDDLTDDSQTTAEDLEDDKA